MCSRWGENHLKKHRNINLRLRDRLSVRLSKWGAAATCHFSPMAQNPLRKGKLGELFHRPSPLSEWSLQSGPLEFLHHVILFMGCKTQHTRGSKKMKTHSHSCHLWRTGVLSVYQPGKYMQKYRRKFKPGVLWYELSVWCQQWLFYTPWPHGVAMLFWWRCVFPIL